MSNQLLINAFMSFVFLPSYFICDQQRFDETIVILHVLECPRILHHAANCSEHYSHAGTSGEMILLAILLQKTCHCGVSVDTWFDIGGGGGCNNGNTPPTGKGCPVHKVGTVVTTDDAWSSDLES